ncbi:hypothetical protein [Guptibacillus spartinae]|uniref:hypothetical protein n=1 Tax=Guptibacillus spartinae TaxID=3025679 RepID=UPI00236297D1|nr:hypothetical protein [Pseudalkalibacillus spartinae]
MDLTTTFTIIGSFAAASSAQIINHILTQKREDKKYKKECLQNLYSPTILKLINLIEYEGAHHCLNSHLQQEFTNKGELVSLILDNIGANIKYAEPNLINIYHEIRNNFDINNLTEALNDTKNTHIWHDIINLTTMFFDRFLEITKLLNAEGNSINENLKAPNFFCQFYLLFNDCFGRYTTDPDYPTDEFLFSYYDLIEGILIPTNNFHIRIIKIRTSIESAFHNYKNQKRVEDSFIDAYQFFYEISDEFTIISEERGNEFKDKLDYYINT